MKKENDHATQQIKAACYDLLQEGYTVQQVHEVLVVVADFVQCALSPRGLRDYTELWHESNPYVRWWSRWRK